MTQQEFDGNKIIAEFVASRIDHHPGTSETWIVDLNNLNAIWHNVNSEDWAFHSSWDWLMPVVEKIESIQNSDDYEVYIFGRWCDIGGRFEAVGKSKIEGTYKAVIKFIQWYNQNKSK